MSRSGWLRLADMVEAGKAACAWCEGIGAQELANDGMRLAAVEW